jgi:hypothetical protein
VLPVFWTIKEKVTVPAVARFCKDGLNPAVTLRVDGMIRSAESLACTFASVCDRASTVSWRDPGSPWL